jgi:hypothetical protein
MQKKPTLNDDILATETNLALQSASQSTRHSLMRIGVDKPTYRNGLTLLTNRAKTKPITLALVNQLRDDQS